MHEAYTKTQLCFRHALTFVCCGEACGIARPCNGGVVCDWEEAPRDELVRKESREGQSLSPTWAAAKGAAFWGLGCPPSARRGTGGGEAGEMVGQGNKKRRRIKGENDYSDIQILFTVGIKARAAGGGPASYLLCPDPRCTHYLDENVGLLLQIRGGHNQIKTLQDTSQINNRDSPNSQLLLQISLET